MVHRNNKFQKRVSFGSCILTAMFLTSCSTTSKVTPISISNSDLPCISNGVAFSLPKTVLEVKITYSLYDKKVWKADAHGNPIKIDKNGNLITPGSTARIVIVDKPIEIETKTIPDTKMTFSFEPESLNNFIKTTDITIELTKSGFIKATNIAIEDKGKEIVKNFAETALNIAKFAAVAGEDVVELIPIQDVVVTRHLDPANLMFVKNGETYAAEYSDYEEAYRIFEKLSPPEVVVKIMADVDLAKNSKIVSTDLMIRGKKITQLTGLPYRFPGTTKVLVYVDDQQVYSDYHLFAQAGGIAFLPINAKAFVDVTQGLQFYEGGVGLVKYSSKGTSKGEALSTLAKETTDTLAKKIKDLKTAELQANIDKLKKEKELIEVELALQQAIKKKEAAESNR